MADRKMKVGDEVWTFSVFEVEVIGPLIIDEVIDDTNSLWHYRATGLGHSNRFSIRDDNAGTKKEAKEFCIRYWTAQIRKLNAKSNELVGQLVDLMAYE